MPLTEETKGCLSVPTSTTVQCLGPHRHRQMNPRWQSWLGQPLPYAFGLVSAGPPGSFPLNSSNKAKLS